MNIKEIVTQDKKMQELMLLAKTVAKSKATVLIQGESGTGKELMATLIHKNSSRAHRPFIAINCAAIPDNLLESELFGYERGAFTGAVNSKAGKFELAHGGTILLDEISEMDIRLQAKLLRVIQESQVDKIGGKRPVMVDVRIIATTNKKLSDCVQNGSFREDLFYRLNVVNITLPNLKERIGDIELLSNHYLKYFSELNHKGVQVFTSDALAFLNSYDWPGNIRELENTIERAVLTSQNSMIDVSHIYIEKNSAYAAKDTNLGAPTQQDLYVWKPGATLEDIERNVILNALEFHKGNRTHTAKSLGISIRTLRNKLADYRKIGIFA